MGDGSSGLGGGISELVKDIGGKVGNTAKGSAMTLGSTVITQVTGQTPKQKTVAGQSVQNIPATPVDKAPSGSSFDLGAVFTGEKNPISTAPQQQQSGYPSQQELNHTADANKTKDDARISQLLQELHKQVYYDPLVNKIEGRNKEPEKSVQEEHEEEDQQKQMVELEKQKKDEKAKLPPNFREYGKGAKG